MNVETLSSWLLQRISSELEVTVDELDPTEPLAHYGLDSATAVALSGELEELLGTRLSPLIIFEYPTIAKLSRHLARVAQ